MARILYGVHGTGHGHAMRALTVARSLPEHEFFFISHDSGAALLGREFPVETLPDPVTVVRCHGVDLWATLRANLGVWQQSWQVRRRLREIIDHFRPQAILSDYTFFLPRLARRFGLPTLSLDHQHIVTCCRHPVPMTKRPDYVALRAVVRLLYSRAENYLVTSFFRPPLRKGLRRVRLMPPLLRESVLRLKPRDGEHVVAYQGYQTFPGFFSFLQGIPRPVFVYGFGAQPAQGNLFFKETSEEGFLEDLASCCYVVCGGSHSLISEALFLGKPVLAFPIRNAFEQFLNAFYLERLGYGLYHADHRPGSELLRRFESRLEDFRAQVAAGRFLGNPEIFSLLKAFIRRGTL
ncbi:MAG: hypothetical protein JRI59_10865 [Deltaproteobacteria bacterium]|nr:hypothetical protein [Deltaproteobacteria bacterium]